MTELKLQQYIRSNYPKENEECEWKEFKNLKNEFCGKEKNDYFLCFRLIQHGRRTSGHWCC